METSWYPTDDVLKSSNIYQMMRTNDFESYKEFWKWSATEKDSFWEQTIKNLQIQFHQPYTSLLDVSKGVERASWLKGAKLNIVDSCFQNTDESIALIFQTEGGSLEKVSQLTLEKYVNQIANSFTEQGLVPGDRIAIDMPMTLEAVAIYLAGIKAGHPVVTIADSFSSNEIAIRLKITEPKLVFTQDYLKRVGKVLPLYEKVIKADAPKTVVIQEGQEKSSLRSGDLYFKEFLSENDQFESVIQDPDETITVLFSSGTTGEPKAIPWTHSTPIKCSSDGYPDSVR